VVRRRRRQLRRPSGLRTKFLVMLLVAAVGAIAWQFARQQPVSTLAYSPAKKSGFTLPEIQDLKLESGAWAPSISSHLGRPIYLYSVIPAGIESVEELQKIVQRDPVAAQQFEGFDFQHAHLVQVSERQLMYVAYRMGNKVYWTRKKILLHPGETLISDGKIVARTRCGNRVALAPLGPHALVEPLESDFDQPLFANDMVTKEVDPQADPYMTSLPTPDVANSLQPTHNRKRFVPFFMLPFFGLPSASSHGPLAVAPEPGTMLLLSTGLVGVYWRSRRSRRKR